MSSDIAYLCIIAHQQAWTKAKILHRNINDENIMIVHDETGEARGYLIGWECVTSERIPAGDSSTNAEIVGSRTSLACFM